jgi:hypothetical protein
MMPRNATYRHEIAKEREGDSAANKIKSHN